MRPQIGVPSHTGRTLTEDDLEYFKNEPKQQAADDVSMFGSKAAKHEREIPGSHYARQLIQSAMQEQSHPKGTDVADRLHAVNSKIADALNTPAPAPPQPLTAAPSPEDTLRGIMTGATPKYVHADITRAIGQAEDAANGGPSAQPGKAGGDALRKLAAKLGVPDADKGDWRSLRTRIREHVQAGAVRAGKGGGGGESSGGGAKFVVTPREPIRGDGGPTTPIPFGPDHNVIEGEIGGLPVTTSERQLIQKMTPKTKAAMEKLFSDPEVIQSIKDAGFTHVHITPHRGSNKPKSWTMAHHDGGLYIHPRTAEEAAATDNEVRRKRGLAGVVHHEAGHAYWNQAAKEKKEAFQRAVAAHPEVQQHVATIVNIKPPRDAFDYDEKTRAVSEVHAEVQAMRKYDPERYQALPPAIREAAETIKPSA